MHGDCLPGRQADPGCYCPPLTMPTLSAGQAARTAEVFKALAHPHRVVLVNMLAGSSVPVCVCDLTVAIGLAQSTVSHHLKLLVQAGILRREQRGIWAYYSVDHEVMRRIGSVVALEQPTGLDYQDHRPRTEGVLA